MKKLLIFDLDGTLVNSAPDLALALNLMLQELGKEPFSDEIIHTWVGNGAQTLVKRALSGSVDIDSTIDEALFHRALERFLALYKAHLCVKSHLYEGVKESLEYLHVKGFTLAIVTNKPSAFVAPLLDSLGVASLFSLSVGGDDLKRKKPHPDPLLHVCSKLHVDIKHTIMVGDSKNDILAAKGCGMQSVGVTYGYNYGEDIALYNPDYVINQFKDIKDIVEA